MTFIFRNVPLDDMMLATRAIRYLVGRPDTSKDAVMVYGEKPNEKTFYVVRNKASISVRPV